MFRISCASYQRNCPNVADALRARSSETRDRALPGLHRRRSSLRSRRSAGIARGCPVCGLLASPPLRASSFSLPSNGSSNCSGFLYGASSGGGLGAWIFGGLATSRSVGEPLPADTLDRPLGALVIVDAEGSAVAVPEIELGEVAVQVPLITMLINAAHPTLEDAEKALDSVGVDIAANVFLGAVIDGFVAGKPATNAQISAPLVGHQRTFGVRLRHDDPAKLVGGHVVGYERAGRTA